MVGETLHAIRSPREKQRATVPVSSEISDFMPCEHVQSNILHIKYAEKTDD